VRWLGEADYGPPRIGFPNMERADICARDDGSPDYNCPASAQGQDSFEYGPPRIGFPNMERADICAGDDGAPDYNCPASAQGQDSFEW